MSISRSCLLAVANLLVFSSAVVRLPEQVTTTTTMIMMIMIMSFVERGYVHAATACSLRFHRKRKKKEKKVDPISVSSIHRSTVGCTEVRMTAGTAG